MAGTEATPTAEPIAITRIEVRSDRLIVLLRWRVGAARDTNPTLAAAIVSRYPDLPAHSCVNEKGDRFGAVIDGTPLPHLLEHMAISAMTRDERTPRQALLCGTSQWIDEEAGVARLELSFRDDLVALRALQTVLHDLNAALTP